MSHEIRTPLNNVVGFSQLIASKPNIDKEIRQEYPNIIRKSSEKLMRLANDILDLSRLEAQMMKFQLQDYDATTLCKEACSMAQMRNKETGIQIEFSNETDAQIHTDIMRLTQTLISGIGVPAKTPASTNHPVHIKPGWKTCSVSGSLIHLWQTMHSYHRKPSSGMISTCCY